MSSALATARVDGFDIASLKATAERCVRNSVKARARRYGRQPAQLEALFPGLGTMHPRRALAVIAALYEQELATPRRHIGFGGEVILINIRAARLWARHARRFASRLEVV